MEGVGGGGGKKALWGTLISPTPPKKMSLKITCVEFKGGETFFCSEVVRVENGRGGASPSLPPPSVYAPVRIKKVPLNMI